MDWLPYIPTSKDVQVSHIADFLACGSYSACHIEEMREKRRSGMFWELSDRAMAKLSGTTSKGNSIQNIVDAINNIGFILDRDWDNLTYSNNYGNVSWNQYYADIPLSVQKKAFKFTATLTKLTTPDQLKFYIQQSPLWTIISTSGGIDHIVAQINLTGGQYGMGQYYDSYEYFVKDFQPNFPPKSQYFLSLTPKKMTNALLVKNGNEYGFYIPATGDSTLIDKALNLGYPLATLNNGTAVDWPNLKVDLNATPAS